MDASGDDMPVTWDSDTEHIQKILRGLKRYYEWLAVPGAMEQWHLGAEISRWLLAIVESPDNALEDIRFLDEFTLYYRDYAGSAWFDLRSAVLFVRYYIVRDIPPYRTGTSEQTATG
jgi:hypothetical protein